MAYHYAKKITVTNEPETLGKGLKWSKRLGYQIRSDAGHLDTRMDQADTLTDARKTARARAKQCGWAEIFRWAENGVMYRKHFVASYERELSA